MEDIARYFTVQKEPAGDDACRDLGREVFNSRCGLMTDSEWQGLYHRKKQIGADQRVM